MRSTKMNFISVSSSTGHFICVYYARDDITIKKQNKSQKKYHETLIVFMALIKWFEKSWAEKNTVRSDDQQTYQQYRYTKWKQKHFHQFFIENVASSISPSVWLVHRIWIVDDGILCRLVIWIEKMFCETMLSINIDTTKSLASKAFRYSTTWHLYKKPVPHIICHVSSFFCLHIFMLRWDQIRINSPRVFGKYATIIRSANALIHIR